MSKGVVTYLPSHDVQPGTEIAWAADCREAINRSVKRAH
ncbi:LasR-specific antiactivator QslA [Pseudomonas sp. PA27(2017)]|nr:LasR-specific antiactivator QslA [Pseudomonas sp. PA27(2017)]